MKNEIKELRVSESVYLAVEESCNMKYKNEKEKLK
jgi:hypothetical protein